MRGSERLVPLPCDRPGLVFLMRMARPWEVEFAHVHEGVEFNLILRGHARRLVDDTVVQVGPGSLLHLAAGRRHDLLDGSSDLAYWVIWLRRSWSGIEDEDPVRLLRGEDRRDLEQLCQLCAHHQDDDRKVCQLEDANEGDDRSEEGDGERGPGDALLSALVALTVRCWRRAADGGPRCPMHPAVVRAVDLLHARQGRINFDVLARGSGLSRSRLSHLFSRDLGMTMVAYRNRCRLATVDRLRREQPRAALADLAYEAGFTSYMQFYRVHRQQRGVAPSAG